MKNCFLFVFRNNRFEQYLQNIDHSLDFVNEGLTTGMFVKIIEFSSNSVL